ncbi:MAG: DUF1592 domain-containing protein [Bryobacterales bacterium]|nr:DUF1592 domain-containing protein [Bryobacterales bacterium]
MISQSNRYSFNRRVERLRPLAEMAGRRNRHCLIAAFLLVLPAALAGAEHDRDAFLSRYCLACHSGGSPAGGLALAEVDAGTPEGRPDVWERVIRKLAAREMPPTGAPHPGEVAIEAFRQGLIKDLDAAAGREPYAGRTVIRRLNRREYANAIRDILALEVPVAARLPPDGQAVGFDNIADALSMSPLLLEGDLKAARQVSQVAVGVSDSSPVIETYPATGAQGQWQGEGMPYGTRGGTRVNHHFPNDGEYEIRAFLERQSLTPTEGVRFFRTRVPLRAGPHVVIVTFPDEFAVREGPVSNVSGRGGRALGGPLDLLGTAIRPTIDFRVDGQRVKLFEIAGKTSGESAFDGLAGPPTLGRIEIAGPYDPVRASETPSRMRLFVCLPESRDEEPKCASAILSAVARRAYRRDITAKDLEPLLSTYSAARRELNFDESVAAALRDVLLSPDFLFRLEFDPPDSVGSTPHPVSDFELASRISFFLWSSVPDDELLNAASNGELRDPGVLDRHVRRMLADARASTLVDNFAEQWLGLRKLAKVQPHFLAYPQFDAGLRAAFRKETRLFLLSLIRENRSVLDVLGADYSYLNERLARNYGIPGVVGPGFRRVRLPGEARRGGLLGQGSILMLTSHANRTSPVLRGTWILDNLLTSPPPPPPANVPPFAASAEKGRVLTAKEQLDRHRADPACNSCHVRIDPLGFALENFDVIGRWRPKQRGKPIDASATLASGETIEGIEGLKEFLLGQPKRFVHATTERLLTYALGRELDARDQPTVRSIVRQTEADGYRFVDLVLGVLKSTPFQMRQPAGS